MDAKHGGALCARPDHIRTCSARIVGCVPTRNQVSIWPPVKVQLQRGLDLQEAVVVRVRRRRVRAHNVVGSVGVDGVVVAVPRDGAEGVALHCAGQTHGATVKRST